jgi:hypothetical protein
MTLPPAAVHPFYPRIEQQRIKREREVLVARRRASRETGEKLVRRWEGGVMTCQQTRPFSPPLPSTSFPQFERAKAAKAELKYSNTDSLDSRVA